MKVFRLPPLLSGPDILKIYSINSLKKLSQNFLLQKAISDQIIRTCGPLKDSSVVEIGPGIGSLTRSLLVAGAPRIVGIEKDARLIPILQQLEDASLQRFTIVKNDALQVDHNDILRKLLRKNNTDAEDADELVRLTDEKIHIVSNLPFEVSTEIFLQLLRMSFKKEHYFQSPNVKMTLMFQKEVGRRIIAQPGTNERCRLSILSQLFFDIEEKIIVRRNHFYPQPKVDASVLQFVPKQNVPLEAPIEVLEFVLEESFKYKNKYMRNSFAKKRDDRIEVLNAAGIHMNSRTYSLTNEDYLRLTNVLYTQCRDVVLKDIEGLELRKKRKRNRHLRRLKRAEEKKLASLNKQQQRLLEKRMAQLPRVPVI